MFNFSVKYKKDKEDNIYKVICYDDSTQCFLVMNPSTGEFIRDYYDKFVFFSKDKVKC